MKLITKLPDLIDLKGVLGFELKEKIEQDQEEVKDIILGKSKKKLLIVGPCSLDFEESILEYAKKLKEISDKVEDKIKIVMRTYTAKPRTTVGWKGVLYNGELGSQGHLAEGIVFARKVMKQILEIGLPIADEMLYPELYPYFDDILSYVAIGARSSENQSHREVASALDIAVGIKNPTSGDLLVSTNSVIAARSPQQLLLNGKQYESEGNPYAHVLLRGGSFQGKSKSNCSKESIDELLEIMKEKGLESNIIVDLNHDNSGKDALKQGNNLDEIMNINNTNVVGYMIESYLYYGNQKLDEEELLKAYSYNEKKNVDGDDILEVSLKDKKEDVQETYKLDLKKGLSVTDNCLGIEKTEELIMKLYKSL